MQIAAPAANCSASQALTRRRRRSVRAPRAMPGRQPGSAGGDMIAPTPTISTFWMAIGSFVVLAACWPQAVPARTNSTATVIAHQLSLRVDRPP